MLSTWPAQSESRAVLRRYSLGELSRYLGGSTRALTPELLAASQQCDEQLPAPEPVVELQPLDCSGCYRCSPRRKLTAAEMPKARARGRRA
jgi:hypothetical protein